MLSITPSNFHFFYEKWTKQLNKLDDKDKKTKYAKKIAKALWDFSNNTPNNSLAPIIKKENDKLSHKTITPKLIIDALNKISKVDSKLMLS